MSKAESPSRSIDRMLRPPASSLRMKAGRVRRGAIFAALLMATPAAAQQRDMEAERADKIAEPFTVAAVGDIIEPQPIDRGDPGFQSLAKVIRGADVGFANMESSLVDLRDFQGGTAGTLAPLAVGESIKALGITLMNHANNHTMDGGVAGMVSTDRALDALGIVHAGTGPNLQEARAPRFLETKKGRVALVGMFAMADTGLFGPNYAKTEATAREGDIGGTPGIDPLHVTAYNVVSSEQLVSLRALAAAIYGPRKGADLPAEGGKPARFRFFDQWYEAGDTPGQVHYDINPNDEREILQSIRSGKTQADFLIATIHAHQTPRFCSECAFGSIKGTKEGLDHMPADFVVRLAHEAIDNGADMFIVHGVHALAGVEIYKGKPILYGLSNFVFQFGLQYGAGYDAVANYEKRAELDNPASLESVLAVAHFAGGRLSELQLLPADLGGRERPISQLGIPLAAQPAAAIRILRDLQQYSQPFGTVLTIEKGIGVVRPAGQR